MRITTKGQVTIPQDVREALGLLPHTEIEFTIEGDAAVIRRKKGTPTRGTRIAEHLKAHGGGLRMSSRALLAMLRDEPDEIDPR